MSQPVPRTVAAIDRDLRARLAIRRDVERELAEVRRRQTELSELEAALLITIDRSCRRVDRLLDERLHAVAAINQCLPVVATADHPRLTSVA